MDKFIIVLNKQEKKEELLSLLSHIRQFLGADVRSLTSRDEEIEEAKARLLPGEAHAFDEILPIFYNDIMRTHRFLIDIRGARPRSITTHVNLLLREKTVSPVSAGTPLWKALNTHGLYPRGQINWLGQIKIPKT